MQKALVLLLFSTVEGIKNNAREVKESKLKNEKVNLAIIPSTIQMNSSSNVKTQCLQGLFSRGFTSHAVQQELMQWGTRACSLISPHIHEPKQHSREMLFKAHRAGDEMDNDLR